MAGAAELRFKILDDPFPKILDLKRGVKNQILRKAVRAGANVPIPPLKADAPKRSGALARSFSIKIGTTKKGVVYGVIGPRRGVLGQRSHGARSTAIRPSAYAHLIEFGTKPHSLTKGDKLARRGKAANQTAGGRQHPGTKPNPFMQRAYRDTAEYARAKMAEIIRAEVAKKLAKGKKK